MLSERKILLSWVFRAIDSPDHKFAAEDGTVHYIKEIVENDGRFLRVVVQPRPSYDKVVTAFFDRRLGRLHETEDR